MMRMAIIYLVCITALSCSGGVHAGKSWWERGKELLDGLGGTTPASLSTTEVTSGLREALRVGSDNVISQLGRRNGFYQDNRAHIPLPDSLARTRNSLEKIGMGEQLDELELRMNRAAEAAAPRAKALFIDAIEQMTLDDARRIYNGPDDAATRYFQSKMSAPLASEFTPIVQDTLAEAGAVRAYDGIMNRYQQIPFMPDIKASLSQHVVDHAIGTIFDYLAAEEAAIRHDPAKQTTALLRRVFAK